MSELETHKCAKCQEYYKISLERKWDLENRNSFIRFICDKCIIEFLNSLEVTFIRFKNDKKKYQKKI